MAPIIVSSWKYIQPSELLHAVAARCARTFVRDCCGHPERVVLSPADAAALNLCEVIVDDVGALRVEVNVRCPRGTLYVLPRRSDPMPLEGT